MGAAARRGLGGRALCPKQDGGRVLRLGQTWEVAAWEIAHLECCHLERYPLEVAFLGKILWEIT